MAMPKGGKNPNAGRKKGAINKRSEALIKKAEAGGKMPLEIMLDLMRKAFREGESFTKRKKFREAMERFEVAFDHATNAAPYLHAKLQSITQTNKFDVSTLTDEQLKHYIAFKESMERAATGTKSG